MRPFASSLILSATALLLGLGGLPTLANAAEPGTCQVSDNYCENASDLEQQPSLGEGLACGLITVADRFVNPGECDPHWAFTADGVVLQRSNTRSQALFYDARTPTVLLNADKLDSSAAIGFQLDAVRQGPCGWDIEFRYFQIDGWSGNANVPGNVFMVTNAGELGFYVFNGSAHYESALRLGEFNVRRELCSGLTLLAGFRMGELDELFRESGLETSIQQTAILRTNTYNHLYGFQLGADWEVYNEGGPLRINALCKSGVYGNAASQKTYQLMPGYINETLGARRNQAAFIGEVGGVLSYSITSNLSLRATGQVMWIEGVALAPEQLLMNDFTIGSATLDSQGGIFCYGGGLGLELKF